MCRFYSIGRIWAAADYKQGWRHSIVSQNGVRGPSRVAIAESEKDSDTVRSRGAQQHFRIQYSCLRTGTPGVPFRAW